MNTSIPYAQHPVDLYIVPMMMMEISLEELRIVVVDLRLF